MGSKKMGVSRLLACLAVLSFAAGLAECATTMVTYQVSASADDGHAWSATEQDITAGYLIIGDDKTYYPPYHISAMRFGGLSVPRSAAIVDARLKIRSLSEEFRGQVYGVIQTESADDVNDFSSRYIASAAMSAASVDWDHKDTWVQNTWQTSPDISGPVQEVVSRAGWSSGNAIAVFYITRLRSGKSRRYASVDLSAAYAPVLEVTYQTYAISGYVRTSTGAPIAGTTISAGSDIEETVTDSTGYYELSVPPGWSGTVTPSKAECRFNPTSRAYGNVAADQTDQDYTVLDPVISGYIIDANGAACEGFVVVTDDANGSDVTDSNGYYEFAVPYGWSGTVTPQKLFWFLEPVSRTYSNLIADAANQDYTGIAGIHISGTVVNPGGAGIAGVEVSADNGGGSDTTDAGGFHELAVLPGWSGAVTPNKPGRTFEPTDRSYVDVTAHLTGQDYLSLPLIVRTDGTGGFGTIQAAIDAAVDGDVVILEPGTFTSDGNRDIDFKGKAMTVRGATGDPNDIIIDCQGTSADKHRGFKFVSGEDANSVLEGLTITNGYGPNIDFYGNAVPLPHAGAIVCLSSSPTIQNCVITGNFSANTGGGISNGLQSSPTIQNCIITGNSADSGGGIANHQSSPTIRNCTITGNSAQVGGGICHAYRSSTIEDCTISGNHVSYYGGGIYDAHASSTILNCRITGNSARYGGGIHNRENSPTIRNCIIADNSAEMGGGIYHLIDSSPTIENCTITGNSAIYFGGGIYNYQNNSPTIRNCVAWTNTPAQQLYAYGSGFSVSYSNIQGGYAGTGNINLDPLFEADGYHLSFASPCLNSGDPNYSAEPNETDIDSEPRVVGAQVDIGADEFATEQAFIFISENQYSFTALEARANPDANALQLCNLGLAASLQWTANTNAAWLVIAPSSGSLDYEQSETLTVAADINGLAGGEYSGQITIEDPQAINSPKIIDVNLTVIGPSLGISQNTFVFEASKETLDPLPQTLTISNLTGGGTLFWNIVPDCNWMVVEPWAGAITTGSADIILDIDQNSVEYGTHICQLTVNAPGAANSPQVVTVDLEVLPPQLSISASSFDFIAAGIDSNTTPQVLTIQNTGYDTLNWRIERPNDCNWLNISQMSGQLNTGEICDIEIDVDLYEAGYGAHGCALQVIAADAENSPQVVTVNLDVLGPVISASPTIFEFSCRKDEPNTFSDTLYIQNTGYDTLNWQTDVPPHCDWLDVSPLSGISSGEVNEVALNVDSEGLDNGVYICDLMISDPNAENSPLTVPVSLHIYTEGERHVPAEYQTIQAAIDAAFDGDKVLVEPGIYTGVGNRDIDFLGKAIIVRSVNSLDPCTVAATVIDCEGAGRGFYFHNGEGESSVLAGLTITGGYADYGGAIFCPEGAPIIRNCIITGNTATREGGGIHCYWQGRPAITNCTISYNSAMNGGGLAGCYQPVNSCVISDNFASIGGGAWACFELNNCIITGNRAGSGGGVAECEQLNSCIVVANRAWQDGGGMYLCGDWGPVTCVVNCTIAWNRAVSGLGGGISCCALVSNSVIWGNTDSNSTVASAQIYCDYVPEVTFSCIQDDDADDANIPFGGADNNNIDDYPMFVRGASDGGDGWGDDPCTPGVDEGANDDFGDLHLMSGSPCINVGNPFTWIGPESVDMDGEPRLMGGRIDMGADEFPYPRIVVTKPVGGEVWVSESSHQITWLSEIYEGLVDILFSSNAGADWNAVETGAENTCRYVWHLPAVDSNQCVIGVIPSVPDPNVNCFGSGLFTIHPDSPGPPVTSKWKSLAGDYDRLGRSESYGPKLGCIKWEFEVDGAISASVTIGPNDTVYVPCGDGNLYKLDANGAVLWSYDANSPLISSPSIGPDGTVYVGSKDGKLFAVDIDGNLRWTHSTGGMVYSSPAVSADGNGIYGGSQDGKVYALGRDGSELWSFETAGFGVIDGAVFASPTIGTDGTVYIAGLYEPNLYALDPNDGGVKWVCNFEHLIDPYHPWEGTESGWLFASPVVGPNGTIYQVLLYDPNLYAIDPNDGSILWGTNLSDIVWEYYDYDYYPNRSYTRHFEPYYHEGVWCDIRPGLFRYENARYNVSDSGWSEPVIGPNGTIYVNFDDPWLRAVEPNGAIKWIRQIGGKSGYTETCGDWGCGWYSNGFGTMGFSLTVDSDGVIYAAGNDSNLYVISPEGFEIARFDSNDYWLGFPVISADNTIIVGDSRDNAMLISYQNNKLWAIGGDNCQGQDPNLYWQGGAQDLDNSGTIDFGDYAIVAQEWLRCTGCRRCPGCPPCYPYIHFLQGDINKDFYVDFGDVAVLVDQWLNGR